VRELDELTNVDDPAWPALEEVFAASVATLKVLPVVADEGRRGLLQLQITARSALGSLVLNCGGLLVDDGWVRVFGSGSDQHNGALPSLAHINAFPEVFDPEWHPEAGLIVGHDVLGGVFALNSHDPAAAGRPGAPGQMMYFAPDTMEWEALEMGHSTWISWLLSGRLETFYEGLRWPGWQEDAAALTSAQGINMFPPLWSREGREDVTAASRRAVPMREVLGIAVDSARQLGWADPGFLGQV
jgi:hypothetical protein